MILIDKRVKSLIKALEGQGWRCKESRKGFMCYPPDVNQTPVAIHKTPSDSRWYKNTLSQLRRRGFTE